MPCRLATFDPWMDSLFGSAALDHVEKSPQKSTSRQAADTTHALSIRVVYDSPTKTCVLGLARRQTRSTGRESCVLLAWRVAVGDQRGSEAVINNQGIERCKIGFFGLGI